MHRDLRRRRRRRAQDWLIARIRRRLGVIGLYGLSTAEIMTL